MHLLGTASILALLPLLSLAQISDNFDAGWNQTKWPIYAPDCNQGGSVTLDTTTARSGKNSLKVSSPAGAGYCGHIFFGTKAVPSSGDLWVRGYVYVCPFYSDSIAIRSRRGVGEEADRCPCLRCVARPKTP